MLRRRLRACSVVVLALGAAGGAVAIEPGAQARSATAECAARIEHDPRWRTLSVRGLGDECSLSVAELAKLVERDVGEDDWQDSSSLFLGRIVRYPELGAAVLEAAGEGEAWSGARAPGPGEANRLVAESLARHAVLEPLRRSLASRALEARNLECEKVLVVIDHPSVPEWARGRFGLPFDAMCWVRLGPRE